MNRMVELYTFLGNPPLHIKEYIKRELNKRLGRYTDFNAQDGLTFYNEDRTLFVTVKYENGELYTEQDIDDMDSVNVVFLVDNKNVSDIYGIYISKGLILVDPITDINDGETTLRSNQRCFRSIIIHDDNGEDEYRLFIYDGDLVRGQE